MCEELKSVTLPQLDDHNMSLAMLMDKATTVKEELVEELAVAYELLASQISRKGDMGFSLLKQMEERAKQNVNGQIEALDLLIAKIESFSSASTDKIEKGDLEELMELDKEISHLQADVEKFQSETKNLDPSQNAVSLESVKVNPAYKKVSFLV
ncbi:unnamed protein product [Hydatigera taeniaeformis]|uniref:Uncharacterized protein n=1 Tax=Hydatigena taeniaeformis TaxID=6205 RepID=A0A3P7ELJ9_HYDTA|nr:unnamed protein product [Hydatigera taeniaeformis]